MDASKLTAVPLFAGLSPAELDRLSAVTDELAVPCGALLMREGAFAHEFLLIVDGTAEVRHGDDVVAVLGPGDFAGEIGAMRDARRTATVIATTDMTVVVMTARDLREAGREIPSVAARIDAAIAQRDGAARRG